MRKFKKFKVGDLVFANEDHPYLGVDGTSPGLVTDILEEDTGQVEIEVDFYPHEGTEVRFAPHELTIVGRKGKLDIGANVKEDDLIMMVSPEEELVKVRVNSVSEAEMDGFRDIYGVYADDERRTVNFFLPEDTDIFKVAS